MACAYAFMYIYTALRTVKYCTCIYIGVYIYVVLWVLSNEGVFQKASSLGTYQYMDRDVYAYV